MILDISTLLMFSLTAFAVVVTPGPDTMLIIHRSTGIGKQLGLATVAGVQAGLLFHTFISAFGISLLIASSVYAFKGIALVGAMYLIWLSIQNFRNSKIVDNAPDRFSGLGLASAFRDSLLCNIFNPKVVLMFLALMPNFVKPELGDTSFQLLILGFILILINTIWQVPLSLAANVASKYLHDPKIKKAIDWCSGLILMLFAIGMVYNNIIR